MGTTYETLCELFTPSTGAQRDRYPWSKDNLGNRTPCAQLPCKALSIDAARRSLEPPLSVGDASIDDPTRNEEPPGASCIGVCPNVGLVMACIKWTFMETLCLPCITIANYLRIDGYNNRIPKRSSCFWRSLCFTILEISIIQPSVVIVFGLGDINSS